MVSITTPSKAQKLDQRLEGSRTHTVVVSYHEGFFSNRFVQRGAVDDVSELCRSSIGRHERLGCQRVYRVRERVVMAESRAA